MLWLILFITLICVVQDEHLYVLPSTTQDNTNISSRAIEQTKQIINSKNDLNQKQNNSTQNNQKQDNPKTEKQSNPLKTIKATVTHYCACSKCNGKYSYQQDGKNYTGTASGIKLHDGIDGNYCAATFGELGDVVTIKGVKYTIVDRMGNRHKKGNRIDIFVSEGHEKCMELGTYKTEVEI